MSVLLSGSWFYWRLILWTHRKITFFYGNFTCNIIEKKNEIDINDDFTIIMYINTVWKTVFDGYFEWFLTIILNRFLTVILNSFWRLFWTDFDGYFEHFFTVILSNFWRLFWTFFDGYFEQFLSVILKSFLARKETLFLRLVYFEPL